MILSIIVGLALHLFERPLTRALTLAYCKVSICLWGSERGRLSPGLWLSGPYVSFAMSGGRGMIDIRDFPQGTVTRVQTLPKRYGVSRTVQFTAFCLLIAYVLSLAAYFRGESSPIYLCLDLAFVAVGLVCTWILTTVPTPRLAYILTLVCVIGMGSIICLAMILGDM